MDAWLEQFFSQRNNAVDLLILAATIAVLVKGADFLVNGAVGLSQRLGISKIIIGATVVSIGTTTPEAAVSVLAAFRGMPDFALGNSVGSIICDTGLIFGLCCLMTRIPKDRFILNRHGWIQLGSAFLLALTPLIFINADGLHVIPRSMGFLFLTLLVGYVGMSIYWARQDRHQAVLLEKELEEVVAVGGEVSETPLIRHILFLLLGLGMVLAASHVALPNVKVLCLRWGVPQAVVAATLIAFGTSLPELVTAMTSLVKGHKDLILGNILGADILNVLFVTGAAACAVPFLEVERMFFVLHFPVMLGILILFRLTVYMGRDHFPRWPGFLLVGMHIFYVITSYIMGAAAAH